MGGELNCMNTKEQVVGEVLGLFVREQANHNALFRKSAAISQAELTKFGLAGSEEKPRETEEIQCGRALLCQSTSSYEVLKEMFPQHSDVLVQPGFGENVVVKGFLPEQLCIGDEFVLVRDQQVVARLQVPNPRRPCAKIKDRYSMELCKCTARTALAGWFFRVLVPGSIAIGDQLILDKRIHPEWNLKRLATLMYSETNLTYKIPRWIGTEDELQQILALPELAMHRWKENLIRYVER